MRLLAGAVLFNGAPPDAALRERVGYVLQTDFLHEYLTVRETLRYAARLRLPDSRSAADKLALVEVRVRGVVPKRHAVAAFERSFTRRDCLTVHTVLTCALIPCCSQNRRSSWSWG
jgi:hypothetical protein